MDPILREDLAVIGTTAAAFVVACLAVVGGITLGTLRTLELEALLITTYTTVYWALRLTTRQMRRPAPVLLTPPDPEGPDTTPAP